MEKAKAKAVLEAILFTMGDSVEIDRLAAVIEESKDTTKELLDELAAEYEKEGRGIALTTLDNAVQMCTKSDLYEYLIKIAKTPKKFVLTDTLLETLSIIAYKQPITRLEIEQIRGVQCDRALATLAGHGLIAEVGRKESIGRPILYGTTEKFLQHFALTTLNELPRLESIKPDEELTDFAGI